MNHSVKSQRYQPSRPQRGLGAYALGASFNRAAAPARVTLRLLTSFLLGFIIIFIIFLIQNKNRPKVPENGQVLGATTLLDGQENIDGHKKEVFFGRPGLKSTNAILKDLNVTVYAEDKMAVFPDPGYGIGSKLDIIRANRVVIFDAKNQIEVRTFAKTAEEVLSEKAIELGEKDIINLEKNAKISDGLEIKITRVVETEVVENISLPFKTIEKEDATLDKGIKKVTQEGEKGNKKITYLVRRENGVEVKRTKIKEEVTKNPIDKIVFIGTKEVVLGEGTATWYSLVSGMVAAHNTLPFGTKVKVTNLANGKSVVVTIIDRGIQSKAIIDLAAEAFRELAPLSVGVIKVRLTVP